MKVDKIIPFASPIWTFDLDYDVKDDIDICYKIESQMPSAEISNLGGYQSPELNLASHFKKLNEKLFPFINAVAHNIEMSLRLSNAWININRKNNFNLVHSHAGCTLSGVIYLKANQHSGQIVFLNPTISDGYPIKDTIEHFYGVYRINPVVGRVIMFPSYLKHYVLPNVSDEDRISIAFNMIPS